MSFLRQLPRTLLAALCLLSAVLGPTAAHARGCKGGLCKVCSNCAHCAYCSAGGSCSVCAGKSSSSNSSVATPTEPPPVEAPPQWRAPAPVAPAPRREPTPNFRQGVPPDPRYYLDPNGVPRLRPTPAPKKAPPPSPTSKPFAGQCIAVEEDGSLTVQGTNAPGRKIMLYGVACPLPPQPYGADAKAALAALVVNKKVKVFPRGRDDRGRDLGWVFVGDTGINRALVEKGLAWWHRPQAPSEKKLQALEQAARTAKRGLWANSAAIAPWEFATEKHSPAPPVAAAPARQPRATDGPPPPGTPTPDPRGPIAAAIAGVLLLLAAIRMIVKRPRVTTD